MAKGEPKDALFIIADGGFRSTKILEGGRRQGIDFLFKGDFAGVQASDACLYTVEALEDSSVCQFSHRGLDLIAA